MTEVRMQRTIPAAPSRVFQAWLDPERIARWMLPTGSAAVETAADNKTEVTKAEVDARKGGHFRVFAADNSGFDASILELDEPSRLVLQWSFVGPQRLDGPHVPTLLTVTFEPSGDASTLLTLVHSRLDDLAAAMPQIAGGVTDGWARALDLLPGALS